MTTRTYSILSRLLGALASAGVPVVAALLITPFALPAASSGANANETEQLEVLAAEETTSQSFEVPSQAALSAVATGNYDATSYAQTLRDRYGANRSPIGGMCGDVV